MDEELTKALHSATFATQELQQALKTADAVAEVVNILLDNSARYGGAAQVRLTEDVHGVRVTVLDRGPGIPEAELSKVLQPFYRVEASRNRNTGGVGLGLASASAISNSVGCGSGTDSTI